MSRFTTLRMLVVSVVAVLALAGTSSAFASSTTNTQADLTVSATLLSSGSNPDVATAGNWVNVGASVKNLGPNQWVRIFLTASVPWGMPEYTRLAYMTTGRTIGVNFWVPIFRWVPSGLYSLHVGGLTAASFDEVGADASITIQNG